MILDNNILKDSIVTDSYVVGRANQRTGLLRENERIMMFNGVRTALDYVAENLDTPKHHGSSEGQSDGHAGNAFSSFGEAMDTFIHKPESIVKYDPTAIYPVEFEEQGNDLEFDVTGDFIDIGRVLEGVPENMGSLHNGNPRSRRVRLVVSLSQGASMRPKEIDHRSERIIRLVDALENANVRTEIIAIDSTTNHHMEVLVKRFDEAMTIEDVAVATHSEFFRRVCFRAAEWSDTWDYHYGSSMVLGQNLDVIKSQLNDEITIYIDGNLRNGIDPDFNELEKKLEAELSEMVPQLSLISITDGGGVKIHPF